MGAKSTALYLARLNKLNEQYDDAVTAISREMFKTEIVPFCRKHRLSFIAGHGTWHFSFRDEYGESQSILSIEDAVEYMPNVNFSHIIELLDAELVNGFSIGSQMEDDYRDKSE